jgi:hypothetical protein
MRYILSQKWFRQLCCVFLFLLTFGVTYNCVIFTDLSYLRGGYDIYRHTGPYNYFMDYSIHHDGEIPYWNPLSLCGTPFSANPVARVFYPFNFLRSLLSFNPSPFKTQAGWAIMICGHVLVAAMGLIALGRKHKLSYPACFVVTFIFLFGANWTRRICEYHFICMVAWVPIMLILLRNTFDKQTLREKIRSGFGCGLVLGLSLLSGEMNMAPYLGVTLAGYAMLYRFTTLGAFSEIKGRSFRVKLTSDIGVLVIVFALGGLAASALLLPGAEFASHTGRMKTSDYALAHPQYLETWTYLYQSLIRFPGFKYQAESIRGAGIAALLLVAAGLMSRKWREIALLGILSLILFDCSMGRPFPIATLLEAASPIQLIASTRAWDFALIPIALLAGLGVDAITTASGSIPWRCARNICLILLGGVTIWSLSHLLDNTFVPVGRVALIIPACALVVMVLSTWLPGGAIWRILLVTLLFSETFVWNNKYIPMFMIDKSFEKNHKRYEAAKELWQNNYRSADFMPNRRMYALQATIGGYEPLSMMSVRKVAMSEARVSKYTRTVHDSEATADNQRGNLILKRSLWLAKQYVRGALPSKERTFPAATTVFLPEAPPELPLPCVKVEDLPKQPISENAKRIDFVPNSILSKINEQLLKARDRKVVKLPQIPGAHLHSSLCIRYTSEQPGLMKSSFITEGADNLQLGKTVSINKTGQQGAIIELPTPDFTDMKTTLTFESKGAEIGVQIQEAFLLEDEDDENSLISIRSRTANTLEVVVSKLPGYRVLTFIDAMYPGWKAYVDGEEAPILLADDAFKAVVLSPGAHTVRFVFIPYRTYAGLAISFLTVIAALIAMRLLKPKRAETKVSQSVADVSNT